MKEMSLKDFVHQNGQAETARMLGMTQSGVSRALAKPTREIIVRIGSDGIKAFELRRFPYKKEFK